MSKNFEIIKNNKLEIHYYFADISHSMDAAVRNKCEAEILSLIREVASLFETRITIETEPLGEGGLRQWLKIILKDESKKPTITAGILTLLITAILVTPLGKTAEKISEQYFEDAELKDLEKEKLKLEVEKLKKETGISNEDIDNNTIVKKRKSNFYQSLDNYSKVTKVAFSIIDNERTVVTKEQVISKFEFQEFILETNDLAPIEEEEAVIEIISPVLKKGKYKWMGLYNSQPIHFSMKSTEFKKLVQNGEIEFKNGSSIVCHLQINREIDNEGIEKATGYNVIIVDRYFQNQQLIETNEGKKKRQKKEADSNQLKLNLFDKK